MGSMNYLEMVHFFDAAHKLSDSDDLLTKKCANLHGHTYAVKVSGISRRDNVLNNAAMVIDFAGIKKTIDILDHRYINDVFVEEQFFAEPTAETIARYIYEKIKKTYPDLEIGMVQVCEGFKGWERANWACYYECK